ncbi:MAG: M56 family metallopeptidase [Thermoguttaceae bacterium]
MLNALLWNLALTAALAVVLTGLCRLPSLEKRPALRHWLWLLLLAKLVTPPLVAVPLLPALAERGDSAASAVVADSVMLPREPSFEPRAELTRGPMADPSAAATRGRGVSMTTPATAHEGCRTVILTGLLAVSLLGTCMFLAVHAAAGANLYRWLRRAATENPVLARSCAEVASRLDVRRVVRSCVVDARMSPLLLGWFQPLMIVPRQLLDELSPQQLHSVVAHELAHLVRRDHWTNLFVLVVKALMWWNPVVWWAERELHAAQELCCDATAIDCCGADRRSYASTLLKALEFIQAEPAVPRALATAMGSRGAILRRFQMIGETRLTYRLSRWSLLLLAVAAAPLICFPVHGQDQKVASGTPASANTAGPKPAAAAETKSDDAGKKEQSRGDDKAKSRGDKQPQPQKESVMHGRPQGHCSIAGKVIAEATGQPVPEARMYLFYFPTFSAMFVNTDKDGTFIFKDIPIGPYSLQTSRTRGYQDVEYDPEGKSGQFPQFSLKEGEHRGGIVLKVKQAYRIAGKVLDENGKTPAEAGHLTVLAWFKEDDGKGYKSQQTRVNHSDGSFVIDGLDGKPVYVMAIDWRANKEDHAYPPIYYPSTFSRSEAKLITFDKGPNVENIDIKRRKEGGLVIAGTVRDEAGKPIPEAFVVVHHRDMLFDFVTAYSDEQGHYEIHGLGAGEFLVHVNAAHRGFVRTCDSVDLDGHTQKTQRDFTLKEGVLISGHFVDKQGNAWEIAESFGHAHVIAEPQRKHGTFSLTGFDSKYAPRTVRDFSGRSFDNGEGPYYGGEMLFPTKSTFVIQGMMPGHTIFSFMPQKEGQKLAEIRYDGRNIKESGIDTKPGQKLRDVTIVIGPP